MTSHTEKALRKNFVRMLALAVWSSAYAAGALATCRVLDPELQGDHAGGCDSAGLADGQGEARGTAHYRGTFHAGRKHGRGIKTWADGERYEGDFANDKKHGQGTYLWGKDTPWAGERYVGEYREDQRHGQGRYEWTNGDVYTGPWESDRMTGALTPMQAQRVRYLRGLLKSMSTPGTVVCRVPSSTQPAMFLWRGEIVAANKETVTVRVTGPYGTPSADMPAVGSVFTETPEGWRPCY